MEVPGYPPGRPPGSCHVICFRMWGDAQAPGFDPLVLVCPFQPPQF